MSLCAHSNTLFKHILLSIRKNAQVSEIFSLKTSNGNTQITERTCIDLVRKTICSLNLVFSEASSQQPYDFRINLPGHETFNPSEDDIRNHRLDHNGECGILLLEIKKTDTKTVYFNDTCPSINAFYIIVTTGKIYKKSSLERPNIPPAIYGFNGRTIIENSMDWLHEFNNELQALKQKYNNMPGFMTVYPRPTYKANMGELFDSYFSEAVLIDNPNPPPQKKNISIKNLVPEEIYNKPLPFTDEEARKIESHIYS